MRTPIPAATFRPKVTRVSNELDGLPASQQKKHDSTAPDGQAGFYNTRPIDLVDNEWMEIIDDDDKVVGATKRLGLPSSSRATKGGYSERSPLLPSKSPGFAWGSSRPNAPDGENDDPEDDDSIDSPSESESSDERELLPWYKRPSPWWVIAINPFIGVPITACVAAKVQLYTQLVCLTQKPEFTRDWPSISTTNMLSSFWKLPKLSEPSELCMTDPAVQSAVATLMALLGSAIGVLSILTTVAWGELSDQRGRTPFLGLTVFGTFLADVTFILVAYFFKYLPGGYRFLIFGYVLEGFTGGITTAMAANNSYIADCSDPENRSSFFSLNLGIFCIGVAVGPTLGGLLITSTGDLLSVFYMSAAINFSIALFYWFLVPESLPKAVMQEAQLKSKEVGDLRKVLESVVSSVSTLSMFVPKKIGVTVPEDDESVMTGPRTNEIRKIRATTDWNMFFIAIGVFFPSFSVASFSFVFEYTSAQFGWRSEQIGYYLTATGAARMVNLMFLLPLATKLFGPKSPPQGTSSTNHTIVLLRFDLVVSRFSLFIDMFGYIAMGFARQPALFLVAAMVECLGSGYAPAIQSAALEFYRRSGGTETGKLFGALSVMQAIGSQIIGPSLFGSVYSKTVSTFPQSIFAVCAVALLLCIFTTLPFRIRTPPPEGHPDAAQEVSTSETT